MPGFADMLCYLRRRDGISQKELADRLGVKRSTISMYETGQRQPDFETAEAIADIFNVNMDTLLGKQTQPAALPSNIHPMPGVVSRPRLGTIACGDPIMAEQNVEGYDQVPDFIRCDFTLLCKGDSMIGARIHDGDVVCIKQQEQVESGQIASVLVDGIFETEATLKRVRFLENGIMLLPENSAYEPLLFMGGDVAKVRIIGLATHVIGRVV